MQTDAELLQHYVKDGSEAAFTEQVQRYAGLVYAAASRAVSGNPHLAKDVTQDVFILLARKAPMLIGHETLAGWLHTTTRFVAYRMARNLQKREIREQEAIAMQANAAPEIPWEQLRPLLDEAVGQLEERDRNAVLLRYFQGHSHREVGAALGMSEDSARVRTERAVEKLRRYFAGRGVATTATLLAEALAMNAAQAAPPGLVAEVATVAHAKGLSLGHTLLKIIYMTTKTKLALATAVLLGVIAIPFVISMQSAAPAADAPAKASSANAAASKIASVAAPAVPASTTLKAASPTPSATATSSASKSLPVAVVNPRAPSPGVYPNRPKLNDLIAATRAAGGSGDMAGAMLQMQFSNLFQKMRFTPEQIDEFLKIQTDLQTQKGAMLRANPIGKELSDRLISLPPAEASAVLEQKYQSLEQEIEQKAAPQIQQLMGNDDNYEYYTKYSDENMERSPIVIGYTMNLASAGVPPLTLDEEERLVETVAQMRIAANGSALTPEQGNALLEQAGKFLTADQVNVLKQSLPSFMAPRTKWNRGAG